MANTVVELAAAELSDRQIRAIASLIARAFALPDVTEEDHARWHSELGDKPGHDTFVVFEGGRALAHALLFPREIQTSAGPLRVGALAAVCSDPDHRGRGLGRDVARAAFKRVDDGAHPVSLFQTGIPDFYARLGARPVENKFINSRWQPPREGESSGHGTRDNPWWNPHIMIYPAPYPWPEGEVDLLGPGY